MVDLIRTGKYGVLNAQKLLNATSNNINNVNTDGYIRKETQTYTSCVDWGVGDTYTRRIYNQYVQRTLYTDTSNKNYYSAYAEGLNTADSILSDSDMSLANATTSLYDALATAAESPTSSANREAVQSQLDYLITRYQTAGESLLDSLNDINAKIDDSVDSINNYTQQIAQLNYQIRALQLNNTETQNEIYMQMLDERDRLIGELSEQVSLNVQEQSDGTYDVYMDSGMLLCNGDSYATFTSQQSQLDSTRRQVYLSYNGINGGRADKSSVQLNQSTIGGTLGGYLDSSTELRQTLREIGKLAVSLADALNEQNKAGFTLDDVAGSDLINVKDVYAKTTNSDYSMLCQFNDGQGSNVQAYDFKVDFHDGSLHVYKVTDDTDAEEITTEAVQSTDANGNLVLTLDDYGVTLTFNQSEATLAADKTTFLAQPTMYSSTTISSNLSKPEDLAFASAVRTKTASNNYGNATISLTSITHTGADYGVSVDSTTNKPVFNANGAAEIRIDANGNYNIYNSTGTLIAQASSETNGVNVLENAYTVDATGAVTTTKLSDQGYEVSISGTVKQGDTFYIEINSGGQADNSNGVALANIRTQSITRTTGSTKTTTSTEAYSNVLAQLGSAVSNATSNESAASAKYEQTLALYESDAGVNLDEEASNLLMYQQTYQSCAKIIEAADTVFNALISAM